MLERTAPTTAFSGSAVTLHSSARWRFRLPNAQEMAAADERTIESGVASLTLMERAGKAVYERIAACITELRVERTVIVCGPGNNGGDGLVVARLLHEAGRSDVTAVVTGTSKHSADCQEQIERYCSSGGLLYSFGEHEVKQNGCAIDPLSLQALNELCSDAGLLVDALLGTGQREAPRGAVKALLEAVNRAQRSGEGVYLVAVDAPTGVHSGTGEVFDPHICADRTITIEVLKRGLVQYPARSCCGEIESVSVGIDCSQAGAFLLLTHESAPRVPSREPIAHKGSCGRVLVLGGSERYPGAPLLAASAALRSGAGLVEMAHVSRDLPYALDEELLLIRTKSVKGYFVTQDLESLGEAIEQANVVVVGPGLGLASETVAFVEALLGLIHELAIPVVIDADGLNALCQLGMTSKRKEAKIAQLLGNAVLTPHPGEMAKLLGTSVVKVQQDRYRAAVALHQVSGAAVVLKGASTVIYAGEQGYVNLSGNPYMATGGSGDVLSGIIGALVAQGMENLPAAATGTALHGAAGDMASSQGRVPIIASDISRHLKTVWQDYLG